MADNKGAFEALGALVERYKAGDDDDTRMLVDCRKHLKALCEMRVPLHKIHEVLKTNGFEGSVAKLSAWLDREGFRERKSRKPRKKQTEASHGA